MAGKVLVKDEPGIWKFSTPKGSEQAAELTMTINQKVIFPTEICFVWKAYLAYANMWLIRQSKVSLRGGRTLTTVLELLLGTLFRG